MRLVAPIESDPQVRVTRVVTRDRFADCENCGATQQGQIGVYWHPTDTPTGLAYSCGSTECVQVIVRSALEDAPADTEITVEYETHPAEQTLGVAA